jgi:hypothetical protein
MAISTTAAFYDCLIDDETTLMWADIDGRHGCLDGVDVEELKALHLARLARVVPRRRHP